MKNKINETLNIIDRLYDVNRKLYKSKFISSKEYDSYSNVFLSLLFRDVSLSHKQILIINTATTKRLCLTKFRLCMTVLKFNSN
ncbi:hypothetical protein J2W57_001562 [Chryseobacterium ginsenosidimutans]|uniref:Uncharacterized protein n=1 Tax=Chryseobacterium geocarposphaerae TaxID=1416776 RepID=A0ABU1LD02_9FLAO|nr:hypothetical protein [Chryseobacterium geocarposphaerae]MDR6698194.1 hypothetical protein [Chryseobacterium ginsenosidimutans]